MSVTARVPLIDRFWPKVDRRGPDECWPWLAARTPFGFGVVGSGGGAGVLVLAHRVAYELLVGPIPEGRALDHRCGNRACCNPAHAEIGGRVRRGAKRLPLALRFWEMVERRGDFDCWIWKGPRDRAYGTISVNGRRLRAHRVAWEMLRGPIPKGLDLDHICRSTLCVNPNHLEPVTRGENVLRGVSPCACHARQTHCLRGHAFDEENTLRSKNGRACRTCSRERQRDQRRDATETRAS